MQNRAFRTMRMGRRGMLSIFADARRADRLPHRPSTGAQGVGRARHRERLARRGTGALLQPATGGESAKPTTPRHVAMSWARRLKRVFGLEIEGCARCGGKRRAALLSRRRLRNKPQALDPSSQRGKGGEHSVVQASTTMQKTEYRLSEAGRERAVLQAAVLPSMQHGTFWS